eukprot:CAMPEP_0170186560 /NCGR_PEP_ID=MMETSP0040_2-20121228/39502_1 /TAXON_ID=641309 /ORGANISM="Lotharella oceanica, Strain CCMP622" /LENGTH=111 /DNA_ID=CAMNT_0010433343 /DNA_START=115 /DNA_END=450 /DNA_ORIENTATION=-
MMKTTALRAWCLLPAHAHAAAAAFLWQHHAGGSSSSADFFYSWSQRPVVLPVGNEDFLVRPDVTCRHDQRLPLARHLPPPRIQGSRVGVVVDVSCVRVRVESIDVGVGRQG